MTLKSMTGYARAQGGALGLSWTVELRSVNGRGLELRLRLPSQFEEIESAAREALAKHISRGNINLNAAVTGGASADEVSINRNVLASYAALAEHLHNESGFLMPSAAEMLSLRGVADLVVTEIDEDAKATLHGAFMKTLGEACKELNSARAGEGAQMAVAVARLIDQIEALVAAAEQAAATQPALIRSRLAERVDQLLADRPQIDADRVAHEVALLASKADVREEIDRLNAHLAAARALLAKPEPVGRAFDFLSQEFVREVNTLCSKSVDTELTRIGLDLKSVIEQVREQVKNIE